MMQEGIDIGLAADGPPCSNNLDPFIEMRLSSLIQKVRLGPTAMDARTVLHMATMGGARVMGKEKEIGSLEEGKKADVILLDMNKAHCSPSFNENIESQIVFSGKAENVDTTIVDGKLLMENRKLLYMDEGQIVEAANRCIKRVWERVFQ